MPDFVGTLKPPRLATAPSSPSNGQSYFDTVLNAVRYWTGTAWVTTDLRYNGDWAAGSYTDGDIVVYGGTSYMCVRPTSNAPAGWTPVYSATGYATTLPASPVDGQQAVLVDSTTNPNYKWAFRYNAGSASAYKWEFVGGAPSLTGPQGSTASYAGTSYNELNSGPRFTLPRAGDWLIEFGCYISNVGSSFGGTYFFSVDAPASVAGAGPTQITAGIGVAWQSGYGTLTVTRTALASGQYIYIAGQADRVSTSTTYGPGYLKLTPLRVS